MALDCLGLRRITMLLDDVLGMLVVFPKLLSI